MNRTLPILSLFSSTSTLLCCALPALLVSLGAGGVLVALFGAVPQLIWLSEHKGLTFGVAGFFLALTGIFQWRARRAPCPLDPVLANQCTALRKRSNRVFIASLALYVVGATFAFVLPAFASV